MVDVPWATGSGTPMEIDLKPLVFGPRFSNKNVSPKWLECWAKTAEIKDFAGISGGMMAPGWERIFEGEQLMMRVLDGEFEDIMISWEKTELFSFLLGTYHYNHCIYGCPVQNSIQLSSFICHYFNAYPVLCFGPSSWACQLYHGSRISNLTLPKTPKASSLVHIWKGIPLKFLEMPIN